MITDADASGNTLRAEIYSGNRHLATWTNNATYFNHSDWLGTERVRTNSSGSACQTISSLPFGDGQNITGACGGGDPSPNHFTGKERDSESGLDNFGARYDSSSMGRFMSPDPKILSFNHIINPQKWNKYAYTLNNPLRYVDPDGSEELTITYRTFIPDKQIQFLGNRYDGNNRTFSKSQSDNDYFRSKSVASVTIETDPRINKSGFVRQDSHGGMAVTRDETGKQLDARQANSPTVNVNRDDKGNVVVNIEQEVKNPFFQYAPSISANLTITVSQDASTLTWSGATSRYPANELNVTSPSGTDQVFNFTPSPGATPWSLFLPNTSVQGTCSIGVTCDVSSGTTGTTTVPGTDTGQ